MRNFITFIFFFTALVLNSSCAIFNSATAHLKYTDVRAEIDDVEYENIEKLGNLSVSIRRVQHPRQHNKWDFNIGPSPSIHFDRQLFTPSETQYNSDGKVLTQMNLTKSRLSLLGNLKLSLHTPIGAFVLTGGYGQAFFKLDKETGAESYRSSQIRKLDLAYTAFISRRFYLLMGPRYYREKSDEFVVAFRIGYFWGEI